jgi:hypothetical protein
MSMAPEFANAVQELPIAKASGHVEDDSEGEKSWLMVASRGEAAGSNRTFARKAADAWSAFVDLLKVSRSGNEKETQLTRNRKQKRLTSLSWVLAT